MQLFFSRAVAILLLAALATFVIVRGLVPALTKVDSDFPNYLTAAKIVVDGRAVDRLYDDAWFQQQIESYGMLSQGKFSPFPPPTALLMIPLAPLQPLTALRWMTIVSVLCLGCAVFVIARTCGWRRIDSAVFVLLSGFAAVNTLRLGQPYIIASFLLVLGYYAYVRRRPWTAGICFGLLLPIKLYPAALLIYFAAAKHWRVVLATCIAAGAVAILSFCALGVDMHVTYVSSIIGNHLTANLSLQDPFSVSFQSFDTLFRRLFVFDAAANPTPPIALPGLYITAVAVSKVSLVAVAIAALTKFKRTCGHVPAELGIGTLGILALLIAPATATYHFVLLWLPVGLLVKYFLHEGAQLRAYLILGAYAAIGFFPYRLAFWFADKGILNLLAYPRLWLLLTMFIACVSFAYRSNATLAILPKTAQQATL